jgi:hypothetical protein
MELLKIKNVAGPEMALESTQDDFHKKFKSYRPFRDPEKARSKINPLLASSVYAE